MGFSIESIERIKELINEINRRKKHKYSVISYKDRPALIEIESILEKELNNKAADDKNALINGISILNFLGNSYSDLGRMSIAASFYEKSLKLSAELKKSFDCETENVHKTLYNILKLRNYYIDDDCDDIISISIYLLSEDKVYAMIDERKKHRRSLKHDPIEMSDDYLDVIDEVEELVDNNRSFIGFGSCHEIWNLKRRFLEERGITWKSPAMMNPMVLFD